MIRIMVMLLGATVAALTLLFWVYVNGLAAGWSTSGATKPSIAWLTQEALIYFWLPFSAGCAIMLIGWKNR